MADSWAKQIAKLAAIIFGVVGIAAACTTGGDGVAQPDTNALPTETVASPTGEQPLDLAGFKRRDGNSSASSATASTSADSSSSSAPTTQRATTPTTTRRVTSPPATQRATTTRPRVVVTTSSPTTTARATTTTRAATTTTRAATTTTRQVTTTIADKPGVDSVVVTGFQSQLGVDGVTVTFSATANCKSGTHTIAFRVMQGFPSENTVLSGRQVSSNCVNGKVTASSTLKLTNWNGLSRIFGHVRVNAPNGEWDSKALGAYVRGTTISYSG